MTKQDPALRDKCRPSCVAPIQCRSLFKDPRLTYKYP